eukprot:UN01119
MVRSVFCMMRSVVVSVLLIVVVGVVASVVSTSDPPPPIWPNAYTINATERSFIILHNGTLVLNSENSLITYYDYTNKRMIYQRGKGNKDEFCSKYDNTRAACTLYLETDGAMYLYYPSTDYCCKACTVGEYCTVLKPTWIANGTYLGTQQIENRTCNVWNEFGVSTTDYWSQDANKVPCAYWEIPPANTWMAQNMYDPKSYVIGEPNPDLFVLPNSHCGRLCI